MTTDTTQRQILKLEYDLTVGMSVMEGRGFYYPSDTAVGSNGRLYVANRSVDGVDRGVRVTVCDVESEYYGTFGSSGDGEGQFIWVSGIAEDTQGRLFITDEYSSHISVFDLDGNFISRWGSAGSGEGQLDGPSGIATDDSDSVYVADTHNNRVQKFTPSGLHILTVGGEGSKEGRMSLPWGLTIAPNGDLYVADWGNDRIQRFTQSGEFVAAYGSPGSGEGQLRRPSSVAVDEQGLMYISDWGNERVQVFDVDGRFIQQIRGQATESEWAVNFLNINREEGAARAKADLEPDIPTLDHEDPHEVSSHIEKLFWSPVSVKLDSHNRLYVTESNRHRIQIYRQAS